MPSLAASFFRKAICGFVRVIDWRTVVFIRTTLALPHLKFNQPRERAFPRRLKATVPCAII
jgi:hypothetical protein